MPWDPTYRSPLAEPGVPVKDGDYLIAIDGVEVHPGDNVYARLEDKAGAMVTVTTNAKPTAKGAVTTRVRTLTSEYALRYRAWSDANLDYVTKKTDGRIAYLHLPNMQQPGLIEFGRLFYPQTDKEALIIDERWNGGGFIGDMIIDRLERKLWAITQPREGGPGRNPERVFHGPIDRAGEREDRQQRRVLRRGHPAQGPGPDHGRAHLGRRHGHRAPRGPGGRRHGTTPPQFGLYGLDGTWPFEGWGVVPDIVVMNVPADVVAGKDDQLDAAIAHLLEQLKTDGAKWRIPPAPPYPGQGQAAHERAALTARVRRRT